MAVHSSVGRESFLSSRCLVMVNCRYVSWKPCLRNLCCSFLDSNGNVCVCELFRGGNLLTPKKVIGVLSPLYSKHRRVERCRR